VTAWTRKPGAWRRTLIGKHGASFVVDALAQQWAIGLNAVFQMNGSSSLRAGEDSSLEVLWADGERAFCRAWREADGGNRTAVLAVVPASEHPTTSCLDRLAHEYGLKDELDSAWAVRSLELVRERGRSMLVLEDPRGEPLERLLGDPMEVRCFLPLAVGIATAVNRLHERGLVHKRFPQRSLRPRRHPLPDAHRRSAVYRFPSHGVGALLRDSRCRPASACPPCRRCSRRPS